MTNKLPPGFNHPVIENAYAHMKSGEIGRREFIRVAALLGASAASAYALVGLPAPAYAEGSMPFPPDDPKAKTGGTFKIAMQVQKLEDPATFSWTQSSNQVRHTLEYVAMTGPDNVTRPMLAESWSAS